MINKAKKRKLLLSSSLALTLIATGWVSRFETSDAAVSLEPATQKAAPVRKPDLRDTEQYTNPTAETMPNTVTRYSDTVRDIFAAPVIHRPAPPPPAAEQIVTPTAPPLPFTYMGRMQDDGVDTVFLATPQNNYMVHSGDVVNDQYRIDSIGNGQVIFTYLPLTITQTLAIGEVQ